MQYCSKCHNECLSVEDRVIGYGGESEVINGITFWEKEFVKRNICVPCAIKLTKKFSDHKKRLLKGKLNGT